MNNQIEIYKKRKESIRKLKELEDELRNLQKQCPHKIVLLFDDHKPHMIGKTRECFCPACGKKESLYPTHQIEDTIFNKSKVIDLTRFPEGVFKNRFYSISERIFNNYNLFYDDIKDEEFTELILSTVKDEKKEEKKPKTKELIPDIKKR